MNFKHFLEMSHLIPRKNGKVTPFLMDHGMVQAVDMGFETYPDNELKKRLSLITAKFYGRIPHQNKFLVFDGKNLEIADSAPIAPDYIALPPDWSRYAHFEFTDGHYE